jgi:aspartyl-tRNA(Asn)/glutamyl-tRNA(Gln) amidotransferase subunit A
MPPPLHELSVSDAGAALRAGSIMSRALTENALTRIATLDPLLHSFITVTSERALSDADRADKELQAGIDRGPLHGIPYALKDIYATAGIVTTCNSALLLDHVPQEDAAVEAKMKSGGAVLLGKLNTHEYAIGGPSFDLPYPPARNPWNLEHFTGGSSSGCGAAVGSGLVRVALGTDTGGSIRSPACYCGVIGLKPTYGFVSRRGAYPLSYSLDHCGPVTRTVKDSALVMQVIAGYDPLDPSSADVPIPNFSASIGQDLQGLKIGYTRQLFAKVDGVCPNLVACMDSAAQRIAELGARVEEVILPDYELFKACGRIIMIAEGYAIHEEQLKARPFDYGRYTYQRLIAGAMISAADLTQAFRLRRELTLLLNKAMLARNDALITATALGPAPRLDEFPLDWPPPSHAVAVQTAPFNVTGNPCLTVPAGFSPEGLPYGMQVTGRVFDEPTVFRIAAAFEASISISRLPELTSSKITAF